MEQYAESSMNINIKIQLDVEDQSVPPDVLEAMYRRGMKGASDLIGKMGERLPLVLCPVHHVPPELVYTVRPDGSEKFRFQTCCDELYRVTTLPVSTVGGEQSETPSQVTTVDVPADHIKSVVLSLPTGDKVEVPVAKLESLRIGRKSAPPSPLIDIDLRPFRAEECGVSRLHAVIVARDNLPYIIDNNSTNGTFLNGLRVTEPRPLRSGDRLRFGALLTTVRFGM
jgi:hypothetical protein